MEEFNREKYDFTQATSEEITLQRAKEEMIQGNFKEDWEG
jgi:hypothetical protein